MAGGAASGASLVARVLDVLAAFDDLHRRLTLTEIANRAGLSAATTLRILRELVAGGALVRGDDRTYWVGRRMWDLGMLAPAETDLREIAAPYLQDIHAATRATVHLGIREHDSVLYLDRLSGQASVPVVSRIGSRLPLYATGVGKILLAYAPQEVVSQVMASLQPVTPYTITAPGLLARQLSRARSDGYATTREEMSLGACSIAVPVRTATSVVAAIGVVVADFRRDKARLVAALTLAARAIGRDIRPDRRPSGRIGAPRGQVSAVGPRGTG